MFVLKFLAPDVAKKIDSYVKFVTNFKIKKFEQIVETHKLSLEKQRMKHFLENYIKTELQKTVKVFTGKSIPENELVEMVKEIKIDELLKESFKELKDFVSSHQNLEYDPNLVR